MGEWKTYRLGEICTTKGAQYSISEHWPIIQYLDTGNITYNKINDIQSIIIGKDTLPSRARKKVKKDDIIFSCVRPNQCHFGILTNPPDNLLVSTGFAVISVDKKFAVPHYVYYYITQDHIINYLQNIGEQAVSTYPTIKASDIENLKITLPPLEEQQRIAGILGSLDDKIELNRRINANLEAQAQALFRSWFVDNETNDLKYYELGDVATITAGGDKPAVYSKDLTEQCCIPIYSNGIDNEGLYGYTNSAKINTASITISARGTIGYVCLRTKPYVPIVRLISVVPNKSELSAEFLYLWALTQNISGTGTTQQQLTVPDFRKTSIGLPPEETLNRFNNVIIPIFQKIDTNKNENKNLSALRDTLLPKLMAGEISY